MTNLENEYLEVLLQNVLKEESENAVPIVKLQDYLDNYLLSAERDGEIVYPYTVNIPRDISYMAKTGDLSPLDTITIQSPPVLNGRPMWTRSSLKGIDVGFGYQNSNKRLLSKYTLSDPGKLKGPHMHMAGKTGGGKSVLLDSLIANLITGYSPYELEIYLVDAKTSGAAKYIAKEGVAAPNIKVVAGTLDASYVISVLKHLNDRAAKLNAIFPKVGTDNIKDFRAKTGLTLPRILIVVDEYQLQYTEASPSEVAELTEQYSKFLIAGRSSGTHLLMCTQSFIKELVGKFFNLIEIRATLTCAAEVSLGTIGNTLASQSPNPGEAFVNTLGVQSKGKLECLEGTDMFKVPYLPSSEFEGWYDSILEATKGYPHISQLNSYSEQSLIFEKDLRNLTEKYNKPNRLIFGSPGALKSKEVDVYYKSITFDDSETFLFYSPNRKDVIEFANTVSMNFDYIKPGEAYVKYLIADKALARDIKFPDIVISKADVKGSSDPAFISTMLHMIMKTMVLDVDKSLFENGIELDATTRDITKDRLDNLKLPTSDVMVARWQGYVEYLKRQQPTLNKILYGMNYPVEDMADVAMEDFIKASPKFFNSQVTINNIPTTYINLVGFDKFRGITRNPEIAYQPIFKNLLSDCNEARICVLAYAVSKEGVKEYINTFRYVVTSNAKKDEATLNIELPKEPKPALGYMYSRDIGDSFRFKRMSIDLPNDED